ncbi:MAG TPA: glycosyltransferase family 4 protein, partial [Longimicrobiales bacterium]|nr:glycosyltransferase family 4 protein [Longimicrobiales bacterium]
GLADPRYPMRRSGFRMHLAVSDAARRSLLQVGAPPEDVVVVHDAVDLEEFRPEAPPPSLRAELGIAEDAMLVGHFGRIVPWKGTREFVDAFAVAARADPSLHALVVGDRSDGPEEYEEEVHRAARESGLGERLTFAGFRPDVPALMRACDIVVHTSTEPEPFGMVIVEAMASGKPVIAAPAGGPLEIVRPGVDGLLADPTDAAALASAIQRLAADPAARAAMGRAAIERVAEAFSKERYAHDVAGVYERVTGVALRAKA